MAAHKKTVKEHMAAMAKKMTFTPQPLMQPLQTSPSPHQDVTGAACPLPVTTGQG